MITSSKGIGIGLDVSLVNQYRNRGNASYIDPSLKDSLVGIWIADQNTNDSATRNIIKNKIGNGGDFEILNAIYKLNSGYGKYEVDFTTWNKSTINTVTTSMSFNKAVFTGTAKSGWLMYRNSLANTIAASKVRITGIKGFTVVYAYFKNTSDTSDSKIILSSDGEYNLPTSVIGDGRGVGFQISSLDTVDIHIVIEQIPSFQGAFVTDGVDDLIVSQKTSLDIIGSNNQPFTVISMISVIDNSHTYYNNVIGTNTMNLSVVNSTVLGKTGIFGYTSTGLTGSPSVVNNILGDKNDYSTRVEGASSPVDRRFSITGYLKGGTPTNVSSIAWYWTFIANRVLTTDEINQIIAYYNLDKYVKPDIYYDVKKQGLSNDTPDSDWYLKDFSGNGRDMQLYNFAKEGMSGINGYPVVFGKNKTYKYLTSSTNDVITSTVMHLTRINNGIALMFSYIKQEGQLTSSNKDYPLYKIKVSGIKEGLRLRYQYVKKTDDTNVSIFDMFNDGTYTIPNSVTSNGNLTGDNVWIGFIFIGIITEQVDITIEALPDYEGAIVFDGITDYGQFVGDLGLKDYLVVADRAYVEYKKNQVPFISTTASTSNCPFIMEHSSLDTNTSISPFSFGQHTVTGRALDLNRKIHYQSTYSYDGTTIARGNNTSTGIGLTLGRFGGDLQYAKLCLWSFLLFPYTLSEFLLERQLKRYKLGTLYPDMVEWRPIIKSNGSYEYIKFYISGALAVNGQYYNPQVMSVQIKPNGVDVPNVSINNKPLALGDINNGVYRFVYTLDKSPQKIDITIDEYIRFEDIVQPYPLFLEFTDENGNLISWGGKAKVGSTITRTKEISNANLLDSLYTATNPRLNGVQLVSAKHIVEKQMIFTCTATWAFDNNEPNCIAYPQRLRIPNSSYKILGYIPDISGHGNHLKINNSAYAEGSGVNGDGSYQLDGVDDFITIPTLSHGAKQVLMKVNYRLRNSSCTIYDQRNPSQWFPTFCIYSNNMDIAYSTGNSGKTYIDGILNTSIEGKQLANITHNITIANEDVTDANSVSPKIETLLVNGANFAQMSLFAFMSFDDISSEEEIKELNDIVGIEGDVWTHVSLLNNNTKIANNKTLIKN